jgi:glycolate oxidase FAD binding subunit
MPCAPIDDAGRGIGMSEAVIHARDAVDVQDAVRANRRVRAVGGGSKPALSAHRLDDEAVTVDVTRLRGVTEYEPGEFTITAGAATPVAEIAALLAEHQQYLPFDPPFARRGATLGGSVATGVAGSMQYRYGGVRDFLIGIQFVNGRGELVRGGGKVVKNAAGFDLPKLMIGSLGGLGILTEVTFKVFPTPPATATLRAGFGSFESALASLVNLEALDLVPGEATGAWSGEGGDGGIASGHDGGSLWVRIGGTADSLGDRLDRVTAFLRRESPGAGGLTEIEQFVGAEMESSAGHWADMAEMCWRDPGTRLFRVPVTPARVAALDREWGARGADRRYASGAQTAWISWPWPVQELDVSLRSAGLGGLHVDGPSTGRPWIGTIPGAAFLQRVVAALDPEHRFGLLDVWPGVDSSFGGK